MLSLVCGNAGLMALFTGDLDAAQTAFHEQLRLCRELVTPWLASEGLAGLSAVAVRRGDLDHAARLLGAATAQGPMADADVLTQLERDFFAPARQRYGDRPWHQAQVAGADLNFDDAMDLALGPARAAETAPRRAAAEQDSPHPYGPTSWRDQVE
jgi:hypothetical protein